MNDGPLITLGGVFVVALCAGALYGCPQYSVYSARLGGDATLAEAESARQVTVRQAQADLDAAKLKAEAEVERAKGVSQANKIIADGLGGPDGYLRYLYIHMLEENQRAQIIYIPTEASLPILEAGKRPDAK